jgi:hypothetical protein
MTLIGENWVTVDRRNIARFLSWTRPAFVGVMVSMYHWTASAKVIDRR